MSVHPKKSHTLVFLIFLVPPLALITAHIRCGIVSISFCNATTFNFIQSCIHFSPRSCIDDGRVGPLCKVFSSTSQRFLMRLRSELCGGQSMCENYVSCSLKHSSSQFEPDEFGHCHLGIYPCHQGRKNPLME